MSDRKVTKLRERRKCVTCSFEYTRNLPTGRFSRCPYCFGFETLVDHGGSLQFHVISREQAVRTRRWFNPFGWFTERWVLVVPDEVSELEKLYAKGQSDG